MSDAGPLITLEKLTGGFSFIRRLYSCIIVPPAVLDEVGFHYDRAEEYLARHGISDLVEVRGVASEVDVPEAERLHSGEIQAIQLAIGLRLPLLIEEAVGRRSARKVGVSISGIAGQIVKGYRRGLVSGGKARDMLEEMVTSHRINERIYEKVVAVLERKA